MTQIPKKLNKCPLVDVIMDIHFSTSVNQNAVFGIIYEKLRNDFGKVEQLPLAFVPEPVRINDPNNRFRPLYRMTSNSDPNFIIQIGPENITVSSSPEYIGWDLFSQNIYRVLRLLNETNIVNKVVRIGIRYINFFECDIFDQKTNIDIRLNNESIPYKDTLLRTVIQSGDCTSIIQISNNAALNNGPAGSIIDIDTFKVNNIQDVAANPEKILNDIHDEEKKRFFNITSDSLLNTLDPSYY